MGETLLNFIHGWFHQDWYEADGSADAVIDHYLREHMSGHISDLVRDIDEFLESGDADDLEGELEQTLRYYDPTTDGHDSYIAWLKHAQERLQSK